MPTLTASAGSVNPKRLTQPRAAVPQKWCEVSHLRRNPSENFVVNYLMSAPSRKLTRIAWTAVWLLAVIGLAAAAHRILALKYPETFARHSSPAAVTDIGFAQHKLLTFVHVLPGMLFMVLGPLQLSRTIRSKHL